MPRPVPILYTIPNFTTAGSGHAMLSIIRRLDRDRFAPAVCVARRGGELDREVEALEIPLLEAPFTVAARPLRRLPSQAWKASRAFAQYRFRLWHSFHYLDDYSEPIIARMAGARVWVYTKKNMNWNRRSWMVRSFLAGRIAAQNTTMLQSFFPSGWRRKRALLVPPGVDVGMFHPQSSPRLEIRNRLGIPAGSVVVACVAHLVPVKGHPTLLEAVARTPDVHLLVAGRPQDERYSRDLVTLARDREISHRVHFLGPVADIPALWEEVDISVLPTQSLGEGCPVALLEAMACGKPSIATDVPGSRDLLRQDVTGILVPPEDPPALASALQRMVSSASLREKLGAAARELAVDRYSIEREAADYQAMYSEALGV